MDDDWKFVAVLFALCFCILTAAAVFQKGRCELGWKRSGMRAEWSIITGCSLEIAPGHWIPAEAYNEKRRGE